MTQKSLFTVTHALFFMSCTKPSKWSTHHEVNVSYKKKGNVICEVISLNEFVFSSKFNVAVDFFYNEHMSLWSCFIMPPPLGAGGIMFSGCPSVRPSVRPSEAWNTLFWPVHRSVGPPDQPLPFYGMSVRLSVRPSVHPSLPSLPCEIGFLYVRPMWA